MASEVLIGLIEHFGDVVACEPVARYLRAKHPGARLSWAIQKPFRELIDSNPNIDETIVLGCLTDWIKFSKHSKYDLVIDLHVNYRICQECRIPLIKDHGNPFVNVYEWFDYGALLEAFSQGAGLPKLSAHPQVYITDRDRAEVDTLPLPAPYCVIHRESNSPAKDWPEEKWAVLLRALQKEFGITFVEVGAKKQQEDSPQESRSPSYAPSAFVDLRGKTTLLQTAEVIRRAQLFLGIDSGPAHLANAVKTPGVVLLGRLLYFRQYNPFTGFYASDVPEVRLVRNLTGSVGGLSVGEVAEAASYVLRALQLRETASPATVPAVFPDAVDPIYRNLVLRSGFFDEAWYITHYPEALESHLEPIEFFLRIGARAGHSPGPEFDSAWYCRQRPDLTEHHDPLRHYLERGSDEGLRPVPNRSLGVSEAAIPIAQITTELRTNWISEAPSKEPARHVAPRLFAFYLPQFHPIAENNYGHRQGFTEWDNVIKAKPLFAGHYQPRVPGELGYYDLRSTEIMHEQVRLANEHGIDGFCFYYYYFKGKKLLYKPIENYLRSDIKAPFFFLWANENWSRRWDGGDNEVIVSQSHSTEDDRAFIQELFSIFDDERYVKINGRPVLAIYKVHLFPDIRRTVELWRNEAAKAGLPGVYLIMVDDWTCDPCHPRELGFDASYEIPSNVVPEQVLWHDCASLDLESGFEGRIIDYRKFASFHMGRPFPDYKRFRTVMAPWDNTPRYGPRAMIHINTDNDAYRLWLSQALLDTSRRHPPDEQIVFLHSWNEWCEGTYVEPDGRYGRDRLEQTLQAVNDVRRLLALNADSHSGQVAAHIYRVLREKDEGAARSIQAMRQQNMYAHRDLQHYKLEMERLSKTHAEQAALLQEELTVLRVQKEQAVFAARHEAERAMDAATELAALKAALSTAQHNAARATEAALHAAEVAELAEARAKAAEANASVAEANANIAEANARIAESRVQQLFHSKSWKLTRPLRNAARLVKSTE